MNRVDTMERVHPAGMRHDAFLVTINGTQYLTWGLDGAWGIHEIEPNGRPSFNDDRWAMVMQAGEARGNITVNWPQDRHIPDDRWIAVWAGSGHLLTDDLPAPLLAAIWAGSGDD